MIRNVLWKAYLEDFVQFASTLGDSTAEVMTQVLSFEADRRAINITINSFGTELTRDGRIKLFPEFGFLWPEGTERLGRAEDMTGVVAAAECHPPYRALLNDVTFNSSKSLEDAFFEHEVELNKDAFEVQFSYGIFYAYIRLKEQEVRNITWISECIAQDQRGAINNYVPIF